MPRRSRFMSKLGRVSTTFVAVAAVLGLMLAVTVPSLLRGARVAEQPARHSVAAPYPMPTMPTMPALPAAPAPPALPAPKLLFERFEHDPRQDFNREGYAHIVENALLRAADQPLSTFSVDVDTAS